MLTPGSGGASRLRCGLALAPEPHMEYWSSVHPPAQTPDRCPVALILNILIVDDRPDTALFLTEFLLARRHKVLIVGSARDALGTIQRRRATAPIDLVITELSLPGGSDGLSLARELRAQKEPLEIAVCTSSRVLYPQLRDAVPVLELRAVLDKPCDLSRVDELLLYVSWHRAPSPGGVAAPAPGAASADVPFFGTGRVTRGETTVVPASFNPPRSVTPAPGGPEESHPFDEADRAATPTPAPSSEPLVSTTRATQGVRKDVHPPTTRTVRGASGVVSQPGTGNLTRTPAPSAIPLAPESIPVPRPGEAAGGRPLAPVTTRLRRSVTGTERVDRPNQGQAADVATRGVACAVCGKPFLVINREQAYSVVCVHCGQLNRIDPHP